MWNEIFEIGCDQWQIHRFWHSFWGREAVSRWSQQNVPLNYQSYTFQTHFMICTNTFSNLNKYVLQFGQIHRFVIISEGGRQWAGEANKRCLWTIKVALSKRFTLHHQISTSLLITDFFLKKSWPNSWGQSTEEKQETNFSDNE